MKIIYSLWCTNFVSSFTSLQPRDHIWKISFGRQIADTRMIGSKNLALRLNLSRRIYFSNACSTHKMILWHCLQLGQACTRQHNFVPTVSSIPVCLLFLCTLFSLNFLTCCSSKKYIFLTRLLVLGSRKLIEAAIYIRLL